MEQLPIFNINKTFNPGNTTSPWSGFASSINTESELRNQVFALQKCSQAVFVPSSNSDLYNYKFHSQKQPSPHDLLFQEDKFSDFNPNPDKSVIGSGMFYNNTRVQVRDMTKQKC
jgi:hypothetical protein